MNVVVQLRELNPPLLHHMEHPKLTMVPKIIDRVMWLPSGWNNKTKYFFINLQFCLKLKLWENLILLYLLLQMNSIKQQEWNIRIDSHMLHCINGSVILRGSTYSSHMLANNFKNKLFRLITRLTRHRVVHTPAVCGSNIHNKNFKSIISCWRNCITFPPTTYNIIF